MPPVLVSPPQPGGAENAVIASRVPPALVLLNLIECNSETVIEALAWRPTSRKNLVPTAVPVEDRINAQDARIRTWCFFK